MRQTNALCTVWETPSKFTDNFNFEELTGKANKLKFHKQIVFFSRNDFPLDHTQKKLRIQ